MTIQDKELMQLKIDVLFHNIKIIKFGKLRLNETNLIDHIEKIIVNFTKLIFLRSSIFKSQTDISEKFESAMIFYLPSVIESESIYSQFEEIGVKFLGSKLEKLAQRVMFVNFLQSSLIFIEFSDVKLQMKLLGIKGVGVGLNY